MSTVTAAIIFSVAGGCLELAGLATVVIGIRQDQKQAARLFEPRTPPPPEKVSRAPRTTALQLRGGQRGVSLSTRSLAARQYETEAAIVNNLGRLTDEINDAFAQQGAALRKEMIENDGDLRASIRYVLEESVGMRRLGVILLGLGIALAMAGAVFAAAI